ncbi:hypothetical protein [Roseibium sp. M-1]
MTPSRVALIVLGIAALVFDPVFSPERVHAAIPLGTEVIVSLHEDGTLSSDQDKRNAAEFQVASNDLRLFNKRVARKQMRNLNGFLNSVFSNKPRKIRRSSRNAGSNRLSGPERATLANVSVTPQPSPLTQANNLEARIGNLSSLERDYHAYLNSDDPNLAAIQAFIGATLHYERVTGGLPRLKEELAAARDTLAGLLDAISAHDGYSYEDPTTEMLQTRLTTLEAVEPAALPEAQAGLLETERLTLKAVLESEEFLAFKTAETAYSDSEEILATLEGEISDETFSEALIAMADPALLEEYGDTYVDEAMLAWAKQVLGVGDHEGKIDEIRNEMANGQRTVQPVVPDSPMAEDLPPHGL